MRKIRERIEIKFIIEDIRKSKGITQRVVCEATGIDMTTYRNIEKNRVVNVTLEILLSLGCFFQVDIQDLFVWVLHDDK